MYEKLLTITEACKVLHVSRSVLYKLMSAKELPVIKITPGSVRIAEADVVRFLESRKA